MRRVSGKEADLLPAGALITERDGISRGALHPLDKDEFEIIHSFLRPGERMAVATTLASDRRTDGGRLPCGRWRGPPVSADRKEVFKSHLRPSPAAAPTLLATPCPALHRHQRKARAGLRSLLLRLIVSPFLQTPAEKSMEVSLFRPGKPCLHLDFVESIFGNAGDPDLPDNDAVPTPSTCWLPLRHPCPAACHPHEERAGLLVSPKPHARQKEVRTASGLHPTRNTTTAEPSKSPAATSAESVVTSSRTTITVTVKRRRRPAL